MREHSYFKLFQFIEIILALYLHFNGMEFFDDYKQILLLFLSTLAEIWSEGGELDSDAQAYPSTEELQGSWLLLRFFLRAWKAVTFTR